MQGGGGGEVLTLQLGPSSGFVGSHFWNIQDELQQVDGYQADGSSRDRQVTDLAEEEYGDGPPAVERELRPEMFYRVGRQSVAPRLVAVDLKHGARSLKPTPSLLNSSPSSIFALKDDELVDQVRGVWGGEVEVHREPEAEKNSFMQWLEDSANQVGATATGASPPLYPSDTYQTQENFVEETEEEVDMYATHQVKDGEVHSWSDFLKAQLNPKSLQLLHGDGDLDFSTYISGHELMDHGSQALEEIMDSVRYFMEECDRLQGIHAISDVNSGFGAIAQSVIQAVRDETRSAVILGMGVTEPMRQGLSSQEKSSYLARRGINEAIAMQSMTEHCSLYVPMPLYSLKSAGNNPYFSPGTFKSHSLFHTSALAGVGLDTFSLTYRRKTPTFGYNSACNMSELVARLSLRSDMKLARLSLDVPFPFPNLSSRELGTMFEQRAKSQEAEARQLSIQFGSRSNLLRPTLERKQFPLFGTSMTLRGLESSSTSEYENVLLEYGSSLSLPSGMLACSVKAPLPVTLAFPDILNGKILGSRGEIAVAKSRPKNNGATSSEDAPPPLSMPVLCRLETTSQSGVDVWEAHEAVSKASLIHKFDYSKGVGGLDNEEFEDIERNLSVLREVYCSELEQVEAD